MDRLITMFFKAYRIFNRSKNPDLFDTFFPAGAFSV